MNNSSTGGFFSSFWMWLSQADSTYVGDNTARLASLLEPALVTVATIYVMVWGYLHLMGKIDEPVSAGLKRIVTLAVVLGIGLRLWLYNSLLVDTFYQAPAQLAVAMIGGADPIAIVDSIWNRGGSVADSLFARAGVFHGDLGALLAGALVWCLVGALCVYAMFLLAISRIAESLLLALGPLFVALALFESTRRLFAAWLAQLANYALVTILTIMAASFLLHIVDSYAGQTAALGAAILTVDVLDMLLASVIVFLILRQVMPVASGIAGGISLDTFGVVGGASRWAMRSARPHVVTTAKWAGFLVGDSTPPLVRRVDTAMHLGSRRRAFGTDIHQGG